MEFKDIRIHSNIILRMLRKWWRLHVYVNEFITNVFKKLFITKITVHLVILEQFVYKDNMMKEIFVIILLNLSSSNSLNNGQATLPPMGWSSWLSYGCNVCDYVEYTANCLRYTFFLMFLLIIRIKNFVLQICLIYIPSSLYCECLIKYFIKMHFSYKQIIMSNLTSYENTGF